MPELDAETRRFLLKLGATHVLNVWQHHEACHGYANCCACPRCLKREQGAETPKRVGFAWEEDAQAA